MGTSFYVFFRRFESVWIVDRFYDRDVVGRRRIRRRRLRDREALP